MNYPNPKEQTAEEIIATMMLMLTEKSIISAINILTTGSCMKSDTLCGAIDAWREMSDIIEKNVRHQFPSILDLRNGNKPEHLK